MPTDCRYKIYVTPHLAAMQLPSPSLAARASAGRQTYPSVPRPTALDPQYDQRLSRRPARTLSLDQKRILFPGSSLSCVQDTGPTHSPQLEGSLYLATGKSCTTAQPYVLPAECSPRRRCALSFYCAVRLGTCRKISCRRQWWLGIALIRDIPRSVSIAVQRLDELFSWPALQTHAKRCERTYEGEVCVQRT